MLWYLHLVTIVTMLVNKWKLEVEKLTQKVLMRKVSTVCFSPVASAELLG